MNIVFIALDTQRADHLGCYGYSKNTSPFLDSLAKRGVVFEKPRRADVVVRVTIDGVVEERAFTAKGFSHDGPSIGEWRKPWNAGEHVVTIEILTGGANATARWHGTIRARERRLNVVTYDATAGFVVE